MIKTGMAYNHRYFMVRRATLISVAANIILSLLKVFVGYVGHSYALFADGIHSFSDLITDALVILGAKAGGREPDKEHPYGHQRIETIAAIVLALTLLAAAFAIIYDAGRIILEKMPESLPEKSVLFVAIFSIVAKEWLYQYTLKIGKEIRSNLLISNAWHHRSDALTSLIVLVSVIGTLFGFHHLDAIGAFVIALLIIKVGAQMIYSGIQELIDTAVDEKTYKELTDCIKHVAGVRSIHQLRTRLHGGNIFVDVHIIVDPFISVSEGHHIGEHVRLALLNQLKNVSDVIVHIDPEDDEKVAPSLNLPNRALLNSELEKRWRHLPAYEQINKITLHYLKGNIYIELCIPIAAVQKEDPKKVIELYSQAVKDIPEITNVAVHFTQE